MDRRTFLHGSSALAGLGLMNGCAKHVAVPTTAAGSAPTFPFYDMPGTIVPIRADLDRLFRITVCLRPFRAAGPRFDVVKVGDKPVVTNYGHGGSGWSLSWGSADVVVRKAMEAAPGVRDCAIIGAGALGLTAALTAQRMGYNVTIYAKERAPYIRSVRATGSWTPDSRVSLVEDAAPGFDVLWERMARTSWAMYSSYLGSVGTPIEWVDHYALSDSEPRSRSSGAPDPNMPASTRPQTAEVGPVHHFSRYRDRIADLGPRSQMLPAGSTPFPTKYVSRSSAMTFNVASYAKLLMQEFFLAGGRIENREFRSPNEFGTLPQGVVICCTGYDSRALWSDESIIPVRGQIAWLIPQEGAQYGIQYKNLNMLARRDGIVMQPNFGGEDEGWNDTNEQPDHAAAEAGVKVLQDLYARMEPIVSKRGAAVRA
jgi:D-amino-acid oxidase